MSPHSVWLLYMYYKKLSILCLVVFVTCKCSIEHIKESEKSWVELVCFQTPYKKLAETKRMASETWKHQKYFLRKWKQQKYFLRTKVINPGRNYLYPWQTRNIRRTMIHGTQRVPSPLLTSLPRGIPQIQSRFQLLRAKEWNWKWKIFINRFVSFPTHNGWIDKKCWVYLQVKQARSPLGSSVLKTLLNCR